jgi:hypothetical protein
MSGTFYNLNTKYNWLLGLLNAIPAGGGGLNAVLTANDDAGSLDIFNLNDLSVVTINGSAYPPVVPSDTLQDVLTAGNSGGGLSITGLNDVALTTINGSAYPPVVASDTLQDVLTAGNAGGGLSITGLNDVALTTINGSAYPPISLPENATLYPPLVQAFTSTAGAITSMFRIRATIKSASFYKVTATVCCFVTTGNVVSYSLSFSTVLNPVINLNTDNLLLDYNNATTLVPAGRNFTMSGQGIFTGAEILNGLPDGLTVFYLNILTNTVIQPVNNPNGIDGLMPTTFYFEEVKTTP